MLIHPPSRTGHKATSSQTISNLLCGIFPILEGPPSLLQPLYGVLAEPLLLQLPVEVLDVERGQLVVRDDVTERSLQLQIAET